MRASAIIWPSVKIELEAAAQTQEEVSKIWETAAPRGLFLGGELFKELKIGRVRLRSSSFRATVRSLEKKEGGVQL